jgi:hypothetical protein
LFRPRRRISSRKYRLILFPRFSTPPPSPFPVAFPQHVAATLPTKAIISPHPRPISLAMVLTGDYPRINVAGRTLNSKLPNHYIDRRLTAACSILPLEDFSDE